MRKLFSLFVALLATTCLWAYNFSADGIYYNILSDTTVAVTQSNSYRGTIVIPSTVTYNGTTYSVTSIERYAFGHNASVTSITIPNSVTSIGYCAFTKTSLTSITIPNSVTNIGDNAFSSCSALVSVVWDMKSATIHYSSESPFYRCYNIEVFTFGDNVKHIPSMLCSGLHKLKNVTISNSVTSIGSSAFQDCSSLTSITIPNSVTDIEKDAFSGTGLYNNISNWENGVLYINNCLINTNTNISGAYTIKDGTRIIAESAFENCSALTSITIPSSVTSIGEDAFYDCSSLTSVTLNSNDIVTNSILKNTFGSQVKEYIIGDGVTSIGEDAFYGCSSLTSVTIPNSVTSIGNYAFRGCSSLTSITIPNSVATIGDYAFLRCDSLTSVTIGDGVTSIGENAFDGCSSLTSVTIPNSVTTIGEDAFSGCSSLTSVTIGESVTSIGEDAFDGCIFIIDNFINNSSLDAEKNNYWGAYVGDEEIDGLLIKDDTMLVACRPHLVSVIIPNNITSIGDDAFYECSALTSVTIPNSVTTIGEYAFSYCSSLTSVTIPNSVTTIGEYAFHRCYSLTSVTIGDGVTSIGIRAFSYCSSLTSVTIGDGVTSIEQETFNACTSLTSITIPNSVTSINFFAFGDCNALTSITIPNSVTRIAGWAFRGCDSLTSIFLPYDIPVAIQESFDTNHYEKAKLYVPLEANEAYKADNVWGKFDNIKYIDNFYADNIRYKYIMNGKPTVKVIAKNDKYFDDVIIPSVVTHNYADYNVEMIDTAAFYRCDSLTSVTIGDGVTSIGEDAFYGCSSLTSVTIPNSVTSIGEYAFSGCSSLTSVTIPNSVTSIGNYAFRGCSSLNEVTLGTGLKTIDEYAFRGCTKLYDVYCFAAEPPTTSESSFENYNAFLHVPCESQRLYLLDIIFGNFKYIECVSSDEVSTDGVVVTPSTNDVTITWPTETGADSYTIVIKKGDAVFCTLTFNADGQLLNIAFAPGRNGNHPVQYAEQAGNGYRFTVTGLEEGTHYAYNIDVKDAADKTIKSYTGEFTTESMTAVENTHSPSPITNFQKIIRNGQLLILRDGVEYTIMGQEL